MAGLLAALIVDNEILIFTLAVLRQLLEIAGIVIVCRLSSRLMAERDGGETRAEGTGPGGCAHCAGVVEFSVPVLFSMSTRDLVLMAVVLVYLTLQLLNRLIFMVFLYRSRGVLKER